MNYELAKKLKDAGFPQVIDFRSGQFYEEGEDVANPSLSELIEACDKLNGFGQLGRANGGWNVWQLGVRYPKAFSETPEEAVASLWLELNKK